MRVNPFAAKKIGLSMAIDDGAVEGKLKKYFKAAIHKSKLPKVKYSDKRNLFIVKKGVVGTELDAARFLKEIRSGELKAGKAAYEIHLNPLVPKISDEAATAARKSANKAAKVKVSFVKDGAVAYSAPKDDKASWIVFTADKEGGKYDVSVSTDKVAEFLKTTASEVLVDEPLPKLVVREVDMESAEQYAKKKAAADKSSEQKTTASAKTDGDGSSDASSDGSDSSSGDAAVSEPAPKGARVVREGEDGMAIANRGELAQQIAASMLAYKSIKLTPKYETVPYETKEIDSSFGKWIETNLSQQRTILWDGNKKIKTYTVSTGKNATPTITGTYSIYMKYEKHTMIGVDPKTGKEIYRTPDVPWCSYFKGGYAYHGAYWHNAFGTQVSHGCINMRISDAKELYDWAPIGTTTIIHY
jgi:lipoprotein-anchoring transpeptidase ErfK/SrfK